MQSTCSGVFILLGTMVMFAACGDDGGDSAGVGGARPTQSAGPGTTSGTGAVATGGDQTDQDNDDFATADDVMPDGDVIAARLDPVATDVDFYKFAGTKGEVIAVLTDAKPSANELDPTYPDLVVTLFDEDKRQIAQDNDPFPPPVATNDSQLLTRLPKDGVYYLRVAECHVVLGSSACGPADQIAHTDYQLALRRIDPAANGVVAEAEPNDTTMAATPLEYAPTPDGAGYSPTLMIGDFATGTDVDVYSFTLPATPAAAHAAMADFAVLGPPGPDGAGSTVDVSEVDVYDTADMTRALARIEPAKGGHISVPVQAGVPHYAVVRRAPGPTGPNDYYLIAHRTVDANPLEAQDLNNNNPLTPEPLTAVPQPSGTATGATGFFVTGRIDGTPTDIDYYALPLPQGAGAGWTISVSCVSQRAGSGVRGLKADVLNGNGGNIDPMSYAATESDTSDLVLLALPVPATPVRDRLLVRVSAASLAADVTSGVYHCGMVYAPPPQ